MNVQCPAQISTAVVARLQQAILPTHDTMVVSARVPSREAMRKLLAQVSNAAHSSQSAAAPRATGFTYLGGGTRIVWHFKDGTVQEAGTTQAPPIAGATATEPAFCQYVYEKAVRVPVKLRTTRVRGFFSSSVPQVVLARRHVENLNGRSSRGQRPSQVRNVSRT
jgi:hypothetical protein